MYLAILMAMILLPVTPMGAQDSQGALPASRVLAPINEQQLVTLGGHLVPWAKGENDLGAAPASRLTGDLHLMLKRGDAQESALQAYLAEQQDRKSPNYHKWLTPDEYGARYGISEADLAKVKGWLGSHGFAVKQVSKANDAIVFSGTNEQLQEAFHTQLHAYKVGSEVHYANASNPQVPAALSPVIAGFYSLNDMQPKPLHTAPRIATLKKGGEGWQVEKVSAEGTETSGGAAPAFEWASPNGTLHLLAPADFATIYGVQSAYKSYDGTGQTIAIVSPSDINPKDVDQFRGAFGLPAKKLNIIYNGPNPGINGAEVEADLDVEWSGAIAPNATVDLVVSGSVVDSILYIVDNNLAPVMSISYGACELALQSGNAYLSEIYKQASSQGITVLVAAGDSGSDSCDQNQGISTSGISVSGYASTPYNTAVGGTDFPANFFNGTSTYWNSTNSPTDGHSAISYIPEAPWNDSCASPEVLQAAQMSTSNPQWAADTTFEALCNDPTAYFVNDVGGGGGVSNCTESTSSSPSSCLGGYAQPAWQAGVPGVPSDYRRHLPDVSFFSGDGLWLTAYIFCQSDATPDGSCGAVNSDDLIYGIAGGTSFASPSFAGIVALLNQKTDSRLGNINPILYELAASQFNDPLKSGSCQSDSIKGTDNCVFHDVTQGSNSVPCYVGTTDNPPNGLCTVTNPSDTYGVLSGYSSGVGYDMASGLGSLNAQNLLNAWPTNLAATQTSLTLAGSSSLNYGMNLGGAVNVTAASGTPTGTVTLMYKDSSGNPQSGQDAADLASGTATVGSSILPVGSYKVFARYSGDASYSASASADQSVTIAPAITNVQVNANRTTVGESQTAQLLATITSPSFGNLPTGSVVFKSATTGAVIATVAVSGYTDSATGYSYARAIINVGAGALVNGQNQITATYTGDTNYATATVSAPTIQYTGGFAMAASSSSLTLSPGATSGNTILFTLTPASGATLSPSTVGFSCPGTLPAGASCQFSAPAAGANGTVTSTLTLALNSPLAQALPAPSLPTRRGVATSLAFILVGGAFLLAPRKHARSLRIFLLLGLAVISTMGCGGSKKAATTTPTVATSLSVSNSTPAYNTPLTLTGSVSNPAATGAMSFFEGTNLLGSAAVKSGSASLTTSSLPIGSGTLTAAYSGDATYPAATSAPVTIDVTLSAKFTVQAVDTATGNLGQQAVSLTVK